MIKNLLSKLRPAAHQDGRDGGPGRRARGFTLLELLIVIALLAILAVVVILVLNPAETLKKARDSQRLSDLSSMKSALGLYLLDATTPDLDGTGSANCESGDTADYGGWGAGPGVGAITDVTADLGGDGVATADLTMNTTRQDGAKTNTDATVLATGSWIPVDLTLVSGGAPLSNYPFDPSPTAVLATVDEDTDRIYTFVCSGLTYELNAALESSTNDSKETADGGDNNKVFEVGTDLRIIGCWDDAIADPAC